MLAATSPGEQLRAPGEVLDSAYGTTLITPRVAALVVRRHARLGDEVRAGAPLATLASVDVSDAQAELRIAEQEWRRVSALGREAVSGRRISEARIAVDRAGQRARTACRTVTAVSTVGHAHRAARRPHHRDDFVVGERIEPGRALYRLVDESVVWVMPAAVGHRAAPDAGSAATIVADGRRIPARCCARAPHVGSHAQRGVRIEVPTKTTGCTAAISSTSTWARVAMPPRHVWRAQHGAGELRATRCCSAATPMARWHRCRFAPAR